MLVGSGAGCDLALPGAEGVAERHARFEENAAGVFVCGLDPDRAVTVNGAAVEGSVCLRDGDVVGIGGASILFRRGAADAPKRRVRVSHGVVQPLSALLALGLVAFELLMVRFLIVWPYEVISYHTEKADQENAEVLRAQLAEEEERRKAESEEWKSTAMALPGSTGGATGARKESAAAGADAPTGTASAAAAPAPPDAAPAGDPADTAPGDAAAEDPARATAEALEVLTTADFEPASPETNLENLPPISAADPRIADAQRMLAQADAAAQFADFTEAERLLQQLHKAAPGFLPAYEEHAKVHEMQGRFADALVRWRQLRGLSREGSAYRARADGGIKRVEAILLVRKAPKGRAAPGLPDAEGARIEEPEVVKLPDGGNGDVVEMRVLRTAVALDAHVAAMAPPKSLMSLEIEFFDRTPDGAVVKSEALTPGSPVMLEVPGKLPARLPVDNFTYVVTRGQRARSPSEYYGYRIRLHAGGQLLDERAKPAKLLNETEDP